MNVKDKICINLMRKLIVKDCKEFFNNKLQECGQDIDYLLSNHEITSELNSFLDQKENEAILHIKQEYDIDFNSFSFSKKVIIIRAVESGIFY